MCKYKWNRRGEKREREKKKKEKQRKEKIQRGNPSR
jgi:hypothetical protein